MRTVELREYESKVVPGVRLGLTDRALCANDQLSARISVRELPGERLEVTARACVGVLRLDALEIRVRPKYLGTELDVLRMLEYAAGRSDLLVAPRTILGGAPHLRDLVALLVTEECERILAHGVRRDYVTVEDDLPAVRGRLLTDRQVLRHHGRLDRLACRFDEHDGDIVDNRLCAAALDVATRTAGSPTVRARARRAAARFAQIAPTPLGDLRTAWDSVDHHRHNAHYRSAHHWAALLLRGGGIDGLFANGSLASRALLIDMNALFEAFGARLLREAADGTGWTVREQSRHREVLLDEHTGRSCGEVRPDLLLSGTVDEVPQRLPVDFKYKLYDSRKLAPSDIYQAATYAHALARQASGVPPTCVLLHPGKASAARQSVAVRRFDGAVSARIRAVALHLPTVLGTVEGAERRGLLRTVWSAVAG
ncbi:McrC family protein [Streptomyces sp. NPDC102351]|uniref:McrC family protein n=1 Tax=Streptomyces sp. NPDC102351 TaxID=3366158 RepID=UPI0037FA8858